MLNRKTTLLSLCTLGLLLPVTPASASTYTVVQGDSLFQIAKKYQTTTDELMRINRLNSDHLSIGQALEVGSNPATAGKPAASAGQDAPPADLVAPDASAKPAADKQASTPKRLKVNADILNVRSQPDVDSKIVDKLSYGTTVHVLDYGQEWSRISYKDIEGFVASQYLIAKSSSSDAPTGTGNMDVDKLQEIISPLMKTRYVLGGTTPDGFDCSGFTSYVFQQLGVKLARTSDEQFLGGTDIPFDQAQPGDLLFYDSLHKGKVSHVAIYLGDGMIVHANGDDVRLEKEVYMHKIYPFYGVKRYF